MGYPLMCRACQHWLRSVAKEDFGTMFAPCALKPDKDVPESRYPPLRTYRQEYVMSETYRCSRFEEATK
jgi:hypothetical protein